MIPKVIHYCWFGGTPLPPLAQKCIASWKKFLPDYEIKEWNESNFNVSCCDYVEQAYQAKKWAFVSDFARFQILYNHGGLYFDVDVEVIRDLSKLIEIGAFMGIEYTDYGEFMIAPGLGMASWAHLDVYEEIIEGYKNRTFVRQDGNLDTTTVVQYVTNIFNQYGFNSSLNKIQKINGITVYPTEYFCPKDFQTGKITVTENTYTIHHYDGSWLTSRQKMKIQLRRLLGEKNWAFLRLCKTRLFKHV